MLLRVAHPRYRLMFRFAVATGLRWSELAGLRWSDLELDGSRRRVKVRRAIVRGRVNPPKSEHGRRDVPITTELARELKAGRGTAAADRCGVRVDARRATGLLERDAAVPKARRRRAGVPWVGFHASRHT